MTFHRATACNATHGIANAFLSVCLFVRLYVKRVHCDETNTTCAHSLIFLILYKRKSLLVSRHKEWLVGTTLVSEMLDQTEHVRAKTKCGVKTRTANVNNNIRSLSYFHACCFVLVGYKNNNNNNKNKLFLVNTSIHSLFSDFQYRSISAQQRLFRIAVSGE